MFLPKIVKLEKFEKYDILYFSVTFWIRVDGGSNYNDIFRSFARKSIYEWFLINLVFAWLVVRSIDGIKMGGTPTENLRTFQMKKRLYSDIFGE